MTDRFLKLIYSNSPDLAHEVSQWIKTSSPLPHGMTKYGETPARVASANGRFDVVALLLGAGATLKELGWNELFRTVALGTPKELANLLRRVPPLGAPDLDNVDQQQRTTWLLAIHTGDIDKVRMLVEAGCNTSARGLCEKLPLAYAIDRDNVAMLTWLLDQGECIDGRNRFGDTPLHSAAAADSLQCAEILIARGANILAPNDGGDRPIEAADAVELVKLLLREGEDLTILTAEVRADLTGLNKQQAPDVTRKDYERGRRPRFGRRNPEQVHEPFWEFMIRNGENAYHAHELFDDQDEKKPVWCFDRFGKSITRLDDGRYVEIAGEHEDFYDPDFNIYNDVFVHDGAGRCDVYLYPEHVFPPTDFHSATLVDGKIWIIGSLGYKHARVPGTTPVVVLDTQTFAIKRVSTTGDMPGWIHKHRAELVEGPAILVHDGVVVQIEGAAETYSQNTAVYRLDLGSLTWNRR